jgi:hypothetical protein
MLSKVMFTLEGILADIAGADTAMGFAVARQVAMHWLTHRSAFRLPLEGRDWLTLQCSMLLFLSRLGIRWQESILDRWLTSNHATAAAI